jgi:hypothetical protein
MQAQQASVSVTAACLIVQARSPPPPSRWVTVDCSLMQRAKILHLLPLVCSVTHAARTESRAALRYHEHGDGPSPRSMNRTIFRRSASSSLASPT